ncbi:hypothetical protein K2173_028385 [Erythroxylum novogranatense]|uniref:Uncharacterized protein n=1 Tax=Erythroxylum novogranatense TaxID=1862640 RepID=A0AAV8U5R6_9ROSI|nr:hypothetical protein K2173_028385 [Erythroxylum novogranatense]
MASLVGVQDDASVGFKTNVSNAPRKGGFGGRTPLGDLSNSMKPPLSQISKKQISNIFSSSDKEKPSASLVAPDASKKRNSKATGKARTVRKALSDISNSGKPLLKEAPKGNYQAKLSVLPEEPQPPGSISEEGFLHNHQECMKHTRAMDIDEFLFIVGLNKDYSMQLATPRASPPSTHLKVQSPGRLNMELKEEMISEELIDYPSSKLDSSAPPSPISPIHTSKEDLDYNFRLIESP